jgi:SnoaL-like domain
VIDHIVTERHSVAESVLHVGGEAGVVGLPLAAVDDTQSDGPIDEIRMYYSSWPLSGRHANRPPVLQPDPKLHEPDVVAEYQNALSAGDVDAIVAAFEPGGYTREPKGVEYVHRGPDDLRAFYESLFSNDGGIDLEHCVVIDDGRACALEYNVVRWGRTELPPEAGVAVFVRGQSGKLAAARIYDDVNEPLG